MRVGLVLLRQDALLQQVLLPTRPGLSLLTIVRDAMVRLAESQRQGGVEIAQSTCSAHAMR